MVSLLPSNICFCPLVASLPFLGAKRVLVSIIGCSMSGVEDDMRSDKRFNRVMMITIVIVCQSFLWLMDESDDGGSDISCAIIFCLLPSLRAFLSENILPLRYRREAVLEGANFSDCMLQQRTALPGGMATHSISSAGQQLLLA